MILLGFAPDMPIFNINWNLEQINEYICALYPNIPLKSIGFKFAKCDRTKKIHILKPIENVKELKEELGNSKLIVIPNEELPEKTFDTKKETEFEDDNVPLTRRSERKSQNKYKIEDDEDYEVIIENGQCIGIIKC